MERAHIVSFFDPAALAEFDWETDSYAGPEYLPECPPWCNLVERRSPEYATHEYEGPGVSDPSGLFRFHELARPEWGDITITQEERYEQGAVTLGAVVISGTTVLETSGTPEQVRELAAQLVAIAGAAEALLELAEWHERDAATR